MLAETLVVLDWAVLIQLVLFFPVFFCFQVLHRPVYAVSGTPPASPDDVRQRLASRSSRAIDEPDATRARAYADALKACAFYAAAVTAGEETSEGGAAAQAQAQVRLRDALQVFAVPLALTGGSGTAAALYQADALAEVAAAPTRHDVEVLRDLYIADLVAGGVAADEARRTEAEAAALAADELRICRRTVRSRAAVGHMLWGTAVKDRVAAAVALLVWSAWMFVTPVVWTKWRDYGRKPACDGFVKLYFVFQPFDPWESSFATFLLIFACGAVVVAVFTTCMHPPFPLSLRALLIMSSSRGRLATGEQPSGAR